MAIDFLPAYSAKIVQLVTVTEILLASTMAYFGVCLEWIEQTV